MTCNRATTAVLPLSSTQWLARSRPVCSSWKAAQRHTLKHLSLALPSASRPTGARHSELSLKWLSQCEQAAY